MITMCRAELSVTIDRPGLTEDMVAAAPKSQTRSKRRAGQKPRREIGADQQHWCLKSELTSPPTLSGSEKSIKISLYWGFFVRAAEALAIPR